MPPSWPTSSHVLKYGDLTARGTAGGLAGEKVESPITETTNDAKHQARQRGRMIKISNKRLLGAVHRYCRVKKSILRTRPPVARKV